MGKMLLKLKKVLTIKNIIR